jgi:hypothetical protein
LNPPAGETPAEAAIRKRRADIANIAKHQRTAGKLSEDQIAREEQRQNRKLDFGIIMVNRPKRDLAGNVKRNDQGYVEWESVEIDASELNKQTPRDVAAAFRAGQGPTQRAQANIAQLQGLGTGPQLEEVDRARALREDLRGRQLQAAGRLEDVASGVAPTIAEQLEQRNREQAARAVRQQLAGARGGFDPSLQAQATQALSQTQADIGQQTGIQAAQERRQAAQDVASQLGLLGQQDLTQSQQALAEQQAAQQFVLGTGRLALGQEQLGLQDRQFGETAAMDLERLLGERDMKLLEIQLGEDEAGRRRAESLMTGLINAGSGIVEAVVS